MQLTFKEKLTINSVYGFYDKLSEYNEIPHGRAKKFNIGFIAQAIKSDKGKKNDSNRKRNKI